MPFLFDSAKFLDGKEIKRSQIRDISPDLIWPDFYTVRDFELGKPRPFPDAKWGDRVDIVYHDTNLLPIGFRFWRLWTKPRYPPFCITWRFSG